MKKKIMMTNKQEVHDTLFACINCVFENTCKNTLPFPDNLSEKCEKYKKIEYKNIKNEDN